MTSLVHRGKRRRWRRQNGVGTLVTFDLTQRLHRQLRRWSCRRFERRKSVRTSWHGRGNDVPGLDWQGWRHLAAGVVLDAVGQVCQLRQARLLPLSRCVVFFQSFVFQQRLVLGRRRRRRLVFWRLVVVGLKRLCLFVTVGVAGVVNFGLSVWVNPFDLKRIFLKLKRGLVNVGNWKRL